MCVCVCTIENTHLQAVHKLRYFYSPNINTASSQLDAPGANHNRLPSTRHNLLQRILALAICSIFHNDLTENGS